MNRNGTPSRGLLREETSCTYVILLVHGYGEGLHLSSLWSSSSAGWGRQGSDCHCAGDDGHVMIKNSCVSKRCADLGESKGSPQALENSGAEWGGGF